MIRSNLIFFYFKMKIPDKLKIGGHEVKVIRTDDPVWTSPSQMGAANASRNIIKISKLYPESQQACTLLHEILHTILDNLGHEYKKNDSSALHNERNVEAISQALFQVFRDNPLEFRKK